MERRRLLVVITGGVGGFLFICNSTAIQTCHVSRHQQWLTVNLRSYSLLNQTNLSSLSSLKRTLEIYGSIWQKRHRRRFAELVPPKSLRIRPLLQHRGDTVKQLWNLHLSSNPYDMKSNGKGSLDVEIAPSTKTQSQLRMTDHSKVAAGINGSIGNARFTTGKDVIRQPAVTTPNQRVSQLP